MLLAGVDLGSTLCRTAVARAGSVEPVPNRFSERRLPLVVEPAGHLDAEGAEGSPPWFRSLKQCLGLSELVSIANQTRRVADDVVDIFRQVREDMKGGTGEEVDSGVLTVPGCFTERQRNALREAALGGGFRAIRLLDDALAAVVACREALGPSGEVLVYSLGAGVFSVTVMSLNGAPRVLSSEGDRSLGGYDFDARLVAEIAGRIGLEAARLADSEDLIRRLRDLAEQVRMGLSRRTVEEFDVPFPWNAQAGGAGGGQSVTITREDLEERIQGAVERSLELTRAALVHAGVARVGTILLVGGATRTPIIERRLQATFGSAVIRAADQDLARGAALYGQQLGEELDRQRHARAAVPAALPVATPTPAPAPPAPRAESGSSGTWPRAFVPSLSRAEALWRAGEHSDAIALMQRLCKEELPRFIGNLHYQRGDAALRDRRLSEAMADLSLALHYNPGDNFALNSYHRCLNEKAKALLEVDKLYEARNTIREALRLKADCEGCRSVAQTIDGRLRGAKEAPSPGRRRRRR